MSSSCITQNCSQGCCNIYGYCPTPFGTSLQQNCYYYYYNIWAFWWIYFVIVISSLLYCVIVIACIVACVRRRRMNGQDTIIIAQDQALMPQYQYQYGQYGNGAYEMGGNGVSMGQPVYLANQNQGFQQDNIYIRT